MFKIVIQVVADSLNIFEISWNTMAMNAVFKDKSGHIPGLVPTDHHHVTCTQPFLYIWPIPPAQRYRLVHFKCLLMCFLFLITHEVACLLGLSKQLVTLCSSQSLPIHSSAKTAHSHRLPLFVSFSKSIACCLTSLQPDSCCLCPFSLSVS